MNYLTRLCLMPLLILGLTTGCNGSPSYDQKSGIASGTQTVPRVGGNCETCELMYVGMPESIDATDTSAAWSEPGQKLMVSGIVYKPDGKTPAANVVLYYWQTAKEGAYADREGLNPDVRRHGYIRGWVQTDAKGQYSIYTIRPGSYPGRKDPAHIHMLVKEPHLPNEYYIDDILFDDDPKLTLKWRNYLDNRGGNGIVQPKQEKEVHIAQRDIILGKNITNYPEAE